MRVPGRAAWCVQGWEPRAFTRPFTVSAAPAPRLRGLPLPVQPRAALGTWSTWRVARPAWTPAHTWRSATFVKSTAWTAASAQKVRMQAGAGRGTRGRKSASAETVPTHAHTHTHAPYTRTHVHTHAHACSAHTCAHTHARSVSFLLLTSGQSFSSLARDPEPGGRSLRHSVGPQRPQRGVCGWEAGAPVALGTAGIRGGRDERVLLSQALCMMTSRAVAASP